MPDQTMMLPADVHATFTACVRAFPHTGDEHARREAMRKAVETIRARHGERWTWKTEHPTGYEAASKDALGYVPESEGPIRHGERQRMFVWDMVNGTTRQPAPPHESYPLSLRYVLAPPARDWLGGAAPTPGPVPVPAPGEVHAYVRDDNERDECDVRFTNGEQCDQPRAAAVHQVATPGPGPSPEPVPVGQHPAIVPVLAQLAAVQRALAAIPACPPIPPAPEPQECPPCPLPHGGATLPVSSEPELQARVAEWAEAFRGGSRRIMPPDLTAFLLYRFVWEGHSHESLIDEARRRGQG